MFTKGQKVVCVNADFITIPHPQLAEGKHYTVAGMAKCGDVKILETPTPSGSYYGYLVTRFAPLTELYADITAELAKGVQVGDTADQPVKVLN